jgi:hypothetical protein
MRALAHQDVAAAVEMVRSSASAAPAIKLAFEFASGCQRPENTVDGRIGILDHGLPPSQISERSCASVRAVAHVPFVYH